MSDNRNTILAVILSGIVLIGWQYFFVAPQMQWTDRAAQSLGQRYTNVSLGGALAGPIQAGKSFFNLSYQLERRQSFDALLFEYAQRMK